MACVFWEDAMIAEFNNVTYLVERAESFRQLAGATIDFKLKSALEAAAREYIRMAREIDSGIPRMFDIE